MKLPADPAAQHAVLIAPALRAGDVAGSNLQGWHPATLPRRTVDLGRWRDAYAAVRLRSGDGSADAEWCCAFDPVRLVADMRDVRLAQWPVAGLDAPGAERLVSRVQDLLADDPDARLRRLRLVATAPSRWYLVGGVRDGLDFAVAPADLLVGHPLREHKPTGPDGALVQRLTTEVQMLLHAEGLPANGVWPHGAGVAPEAAPVRLPTLYSDDPFWRGCWAAAAPDAPVAAWAEAASLPGGAVFAPSSSEAAATLDRLAAMPHLSRIDVVTGDGLSGLHRGGPLRRLLARLRA